MKNKGFTLVELLGVLVILAILLTIIIVSVGKIISNSQDSLSNTQKRRIEEVAKQYNIERGNLDSATSCVDVTTLINLGYLEGESVIDPKTKAAMTGSVLITYSSNQYTYRYQETACPSQ